MNGAKLVGINPKNLLDKLLKPTEKVFGYDGDILSKVPENFTDKLTYKD